MISRNYIFLLLFALSGCAQEKMNGLSFVASNREITSEAVQKVAAMNANWVTLMPFGFMKSTSDTSVRFNSSFQWRNERKEGVEQSIKIFNKHKIKVMLKPQIWIGRGDFTGYIKMDNSRDWTAFEKNYTAFILFYAKIAQTNNCELYCIGTELNDFVAARPQYWLQLVKDVRKVYRGKITYAENWDRFETLTFVDQLDYIGINAYFPLATSQTPTVKEIEIAWQPIKSRLKSFSKKHDKKIIFTEFGYQSKDFATLEPWDYNKHRIVNLAAQNNALTAIFEEFWDENWFAGGFLWKWYDTHEKSGGVDDTDYTVQNKPAEVIVRERFGKYHRQ